MFQLVFGDEGFGRRIKTADDGGGNGRADSSPGKNVSRACLELPPELLKEAVGDKDLDQALCVFKLLRDVIGHGVRCWGGDFAVTAEGVEEERRGAGGHMI